MPTVVRLSNCVVTVYAADHLPPHFHVRMKDGREALIEISTLKVLTASVTKRELSEALVWAVDNQALLLKKWKELNR